jgi:hypothetical protein
VGCKKRAIVRIAERGGQFRNERVSLPDSDVQARWFVAKKKPGFRRAGFSNSLQLAAVN